eukprot:8046848-Lingulodinium_polyedra.AAC.1
MTAAGARELPGGPAGPRGRPPGGRSARAPSRQRDPCAGGPAATRPVAWPLIFTRFAPRPHR